MSLTLVLSISILIRVVATLLALVLLYRIRDWRMGFLALMLGFMGYRQVLTLSSTLSAKAEEILPATTELPGLVVSVLGLLTVVFLERLLVKYRREQQAMRASEQYNRMLFESSPIGLALCRMDGSLVDINPVYAEIIGRTVEETLALTYWDITPKEYAEQEAQQLQSLEATGHYEPYEKEYIHKDGRRVPVRLTGLTVERNGERFIWSSVEDITARKRAEEALRASEERYRLLYENVPVMNFTVGKDGKVLAVNHFGVEQLGYSVEELVGQPVVNVFRDEDRPSVRRQLKECFQNPERVFEWELCKVHKDSHLLWVHETARVMQEKDRPVLLIACQNITERKQAEAEVRRSNEELAALNTLGRQVSQSLSLDAVVSEAVKEMVKVVQTDLAFLFLREGEKLTLASIGPQGAVSKRTVARLGRSTRLGWIYCRKMVYPPS